MIKIEYIDDEGSLREWLTDWPRENGLDEDAARAVAVTIAHRAAMRVLPVWWDWTLTETARKLDLTALPILRCSLISGVAVLVPTPEIKRAAATSTAADATADATSTSTAAFAFAFAATAAFARAADATAAAADAAADAFAADATTFWEEIRTDCERIASKQDVFATPLWRNRENPYETRWRDVKSRTPGLEWAFWIKWYEDALAGKVPNWDMLEQIALIESEVWDEGVEAVAERIEEILDAYGPDGDQSDANATPELALARNSKVIRLQLDTLMVFVEDEIQRLRGPNDIPESVMARIALLEGIVDAVKAMQSTLTDKAQPGGTALTVIEEKLPQIFETADELAKQDGSSEVSERVVVMAATIEHLTKCGTPAYAATGIAVADMVFKTIKSWLSRSKPSTD